LGCTAQTSAIARVVCLFPFSLVQPRIVRLPFLLGFLSHCDNDPLSPPEDLAFTGRDPSRDLGPRSFFTTAKKLAPVAGDNRPRPTPANKNPFFFFFFSCPGGINFFSVVTVFSFSFSLLFFFVFILMVCYVKIFFVLSVVPCPFFLLGVGNSLFSPPVQVVCPTPFFFSPVSLFFVLIYISVFAHP